MARNDKTISAVRDLVTPLLGSMGKELVYLEFVQEHGKWTLRLYVDREDSSGITIDELAEINRDVGALLDVEGVIPGSYSLEVSSPGLNRPLGKIEDCEKYAGRMAKVRTTEPIEGRRKFRGVLKGTEEDAMILLDAGDRIYKIPWRIVKKANLKGEIEFGEK